MKTKILLIALILFSCKEKNAEFNFDFEPGQITFFDSIIIEEQGTAFNFVFNEKIVQDSILLFGDGSFSSIHLFNIKTGEKIGFFNPDSIHFPLPQKSYANAFVRNDSIFFLNHMLKKIYIFDFNENLLGELELDFQKPNFVLDYEMFFEEIDDKIYISTRYDGPISEAFKESTVLSMFNRKNGEYLKSFGSFPETYKFGALSLSQSENILYKNGFIYILNVVGVPIIKKYTLNGDLIDFIPIQSKIHNPELSYFNDDASESQLMDQILSFGTDQKSNDEVFYVSFTHFTDRHKQSGYDTFSYVIMKIDLNNKIIKEEQLLGPWHYFEMRSLLREVKGDTLHLLVRGYDENLYLKKFTFD